MNKRTKINLKMTNRCAVDVHNRLSDIINALPETFTEVDITKYEDLTIKLCECRIGLSLIIDALNDIDIES